MPCHWITAKPVDFAVFQPRRQMATKWTELDSEKYLKQHKSFSERLQHLIKTHDRLNVEEYLEEMKQYGARPNPAVYQELVRWFADHDQLSGPSNQHLLH